MKINHKEVCISIQCPFCHRGHEVEVNEMDYLDWEDGVLAQIAFPYLSSTEREQLISHMCPDCQHDFFN